MNSGCKLLSHVCGGILTTYIQVIFTLRAVFMHCLIDLCGFTFVGYNSMFVARHCKSYCESDVLCGFFIRDAHCARELNHHLDDDIYYMCTV